MTSHHAVSRVVCDGSLHYRRSQKQRPGRPLVVAEKELCARRRVLGNLVPQRRYVFFTNSEVRYPLACCAFRDPVNLTRPNITGNGVKGGCLARDPTLMAGSALGLEGLDGFAGRSLGTRR